VDEKFSEHLAAAALAAYFVSDPEVWQQFTDWCIARGTVHEGEKMSRQAMRDASRNMWQVRRQIEIELLAERIGVALRKEES
jgi:hypothetical protein